MDEQPAPARIGRRIIGTARAASASSPSKTSSDASSASRTTSGAASSLSPTSTHRHLSVPSPSSPGGGNPFDDPSDADSPSSPRPSHSRSSSRNSPSAHPPSAQPASSRTVITVVDPSRPDVDADAADADADAELFTPPPLPPRSLSRRTVADAVEGLSDWPESRLPAAKVRSLCLSSFLSHP